jgi:hypothetical protein
MTKPKKKAKAKRALTVRKAQAKKKKAAKDASALVNLKVAQSCKNVLMAKAKKFTKGNLSLWLRMAGMNYVPSDSALLAALSQ